MIEIDPAQLTAFADAMFRYADEGGWVSLRTFREGVPEKPVSIQPVQLNGDPAVLATAASDEARYAASHRRPTVFCPPICTFVGKDKADEASLACGLALTVELDADAERAWKRLESCSRYPPPSWLRAVACGTIPRAARASPSCICIGGCVSLRARSKHTPG